MGIRDYGSVSPYLTHRVGIGPKFNPTGRSFNHAPERGRGEEGEGVRVCVLTDVLLHYHSKNAETGA